MKKIQIVCVIMLSFILSGYVSYDDGHIRYDINPDLTGRITLVLNNIHSSEKNIAAQKQEIQDFYRKGYFVETEYFAQDYSFDADEKIFLRSDALSCDARLSGNSSNIVKSLIPFQRSFDSFSIRKENNHLFVHLVYSDKGQTGMIKTFTVQYKGRIISNNAAEYDKETGTMKWYFSEEPRAVDFIIDLN